MRRSPKNLFMESLEHRRVLSVVPFSDPTIISSPQDDWSGFVRDMALSDIDGDGDLDLLQARSNEGLFEVVHRVNLGGGQFDRPVRQELGNDLPPNATLILADVNGDGSLDVVGRNDANELVWFENTNDSSNLYSSVPKPLAIPESGISTRLLSIEDLNGDDLNDLLVFTWTQGKRNLEWFRNIADSGYEKYSLGESGSAIGFFPNAVARDIDRDGDLDLFNIGKDEIHLLENVGGESNVFADPVNLGWDISGLRTVRNSLLLETMDVDRDGDEDLLIGDSNGFLWSNNNGGVFAQPQQIEKVDRRLTPSNGSTFRFDANDDGFDEPIMLSLFGSLIWYSDPLNQSIETLNTLAMPVTVAGDIDGDGDSDWVKTDFPGNTVSWFDKISDEAQANIIDMPDLVTPSNLQAIDIDADGDQDAVLESGRDLVWYENLGNGDFASVSALGDFPAIGRIHFAEINGDDREDIYYSRSNDAGEVSTVWHANSSDGFGAAIAPPGETGLGSLQDVDGDGTLDFIVYPANQDSERVAYLNDGEGNFSESNVFALPGGPDESLIASDINGNGKTDFIGVINDEIAFYKNDGNNNFERLILIEPEPNPTIPGFFGIPRGFHLADFDGDSDQDLLVVNESDQPSRYRLEFLENDGVDFALANTITITGYPNDLSFVDLDSDGDLDIATVVNNRPAYIENVGELTFQPQGAIEGAQEGSEIAVADVDGDGDSDILVLDNLPAALSLLRNEINPDPILITSAEIDRMHAAIRAGSEDTEFDWNQDNAVDPLDVDYLLNELGTARGDANFDLSVDFRDFLVVATNFGMSDGKWGDGDFDGNGKVEFADFLLLSANFGFKSE